MTTETCFTRYFLVVPLTWWIVECFSYVSWWWSLSTPLSCYISHSLSFHLPLLVCPEAYDMLKDIDRKGVTLGPAPYDSLIRALLAEGSMEDAMVVKEMWVCLSCVCSPVSMSCVLSLTPPLYLPMVLTKKPHTFTVGYFHTRSQILVCHRLSLQYTGQPGLLN